MAWGFMDWVRGRPFRRDPNELTLRPNASPGELRAMAMRLLDNPHAYKAYELLCEQREAARPVLEDLVRSDPRFRSMSDVRKSWNRPIFHVALGILNEWESGYAIEQALELAGSPEPTRRALAARLLAETGEGRFAPALARLAADADAEVRDAVARGLSDVIEYGEQHGRTLDDRLARAMYDLMLCCTLRTDRGPGVDFLPVLVRLDRERTLRELASDVSLVSERNWLGHILETLREERVVVAADKLRMLLREAVAVFDRPDFSWADYVGQDTLVAELLVSLAQHDRAEAVQVAASLAKHPRDEARKAGQEAREKLTATDPVRVAVEAKQAAGRDLLLMQPEHRAVYLVWLLDAEVCNGGWLQWAANPSGEHAAETLDALRELGLDAAAAQLEMLMEALGPAGSSDEQDERMAAIDHALSAGKTLPSDSDFWDMGTQIRAAIYDYAEANRDVFNDG